jgi:5,10-methylenetetrahydromethanopterin reductase
VATAAAFASLAELAPGRIVAGFGAGGSRVLESMGFAPARPFSALAETVDVVRALLAGEVVDHSGHFIAQGVALPWAAGPLPIAIAGRGPRVERLAGERADWVLLAGKALDRVEGLVARTRAAGLAARGRAPAIAWNPVAAWTDAMAADVRSHLAYIAVDLPPWDRLALGIDDGLAARLRAIVASEGPDAAAPLVPQGVVDHYALVGDRAAVVARLGELSGRMAPELVVFDAGDYSAGFVAELAAVAHDAGAVDGCKDWGGAGSTLD